MNQKICVSIIIACFERAKELQRLLFSLKKLDFSEPLEIIVIDDGSKRHRAIKMVVDEFLTTKKNNIQYLLIRLDKNLGPSIARNIGVKKAKGEFLWFLDSDTEADDPYLLTTMVGCLRQNGFLAGVGGEIIKTNEKIYAAFLHYLPNWIPISKHIPVDKSFEMHPKIIATNNLLVPKRDFLSVAGFLPYFDMYEDQDLCLRLARSGKSFLVRNDTCIIHYHSSSGREGGKFWFFNKMWDYTLNMHKGRVKILFLHFPYRLPILPLLDIVFTPLVFLSQMFFSETRCSDLFQKKSKSSSRSFPMFVCFNLMAMFWAWFMAWTLIVKSFIIGKKAIVEKR